MKKLITLFICAIAACSISAQTLNEVHLCIDSHDNIVNTYIIDPSTVFEGEFQLDLSGVSQGMHRLYVDVVDDTGVVSHYTSRTFLVSGKIGMAVLTNVEYFFDEDPGLGNGLMLSVENIAELQTQFNLSIPENLTPGMHRLYVRTLDGGGQWSHYDSFLFNAAGSVNMATLTRIEYSFDEMPSESHSIWTINNPNGNIDQSISIEVPSDMPLGNHTVYVRCGNADGTWSHYATFPVSICATYAPVATFDAIRYQGGEYVALNNTSSNASSLQWTIDGNNQGVNDSLFLHFDQPGQHNACVNVTNACGADQSCQTISVNGISDFLPSQGTRLGVLSMNIRGGFSPDADVRLIRDGFNDIIASEVVFLSSGELRVLFDLRGQSIGFYQLQVSLIEGDVFIANNQFEIIDGRLADINLTLIGKRLSRAGRAEPYHLLIENFGDEDAIGVPILLRQIPVDIATMLPGDSLEMFDISNHDFFTDLFAAQQATGFDPALITDYIKNPTDDTYGYGYIIPQVPARSNVSIDFTISSLNPGFQMNARTSFYPWLKSNAALEGESDIANPQCRSFEFKQILEVVNGNAIDEITWTSCFDAAYSEALQFLANLSVNSSYTTTQLIPLPAYNGAILQTCANCLGISLDQEEWTFALGRFDQLSKFMTVDYDQCNQIGNVGFVVEQNQRLNADNDERVFDCIPPDGGNGFNSGAFMGGLNPANKDAFENLCRIMSSDPNAKEGPIANGAWINEQRSIPYQIWFENEETATAAAQVVVLTDTIDAERFDFSTFEWVAFGFDDNLYSIPDQRTEHYEVIDLRPALPNLVKYTATFDPITGIAQARFETLDTLTLALTTDPLQGFLPPNVTHPQGQGFVAFRIDTRNDLSAGDLIANEASILFDENPVIHTAPWWLWYDDIKPVAHFTNSNELSGDTYTLTWDELDEHSGINHIEIYQIDQGQATLFAVLPNNTGSMVIDAQVGDILNFGILAYDNAGNVQEEMSMMQVSIVNGLLEKQYESYRVYPNPFNENLSIEAKGKMNTTWQLFDISGKCIQSGKIQTEKSTLTFDHLSPGSYLLRIEDWQTMLVKLDGAK